MNRLFATSSQVTASGPADGGISPPASPVVTVRAAVSVPGIVQDPSAASTLHAADRVSLTGGTHVAFEVMPARLNMVTHGGTEVEKIRSPMATIEAAQAAPASDSVIVTPGGVANVGAVVTLPRHGDDLEPINALGVTPKAVSNISCLAASAQDMDRGTPRFLHTHAAGQVRKCSCKEGW